MSGGQFLRIGGMTIALRGAGGPVWWEWDAAATRFLVPPSPADVEISVTSAPPPPCSGELLFDSGAVWRLHRDPAGYRVECRAGRFGAEPYRVAAFDQSFTRGEVFVSPAAVESRVHPLEYPLDEVLVSNLLGRGRGIEIHSCGVIDHDGRGHLFAGMSGAGKTTTARLWGHAAAAVVSDDRVIVREEEGTFWMYGTPWHGEAELSSPRRAPLAGVCLLVQAESNALLPLPPATAVARLFGCTFPPFYHADSLAFSLSFLERLADRVPVRELQFTRDGGLVELVLAIAPR